MNDLKFAITLTICCCICLTMAASASADFVGVTTVIKDDAETAFQCTQGNGDFVPGPLTVCNVFAVFDDPADRLLSVFNADLQVYDGENPDVFYHHPFGGNTPYDCFLQEAVFPDLVCDSYVAIGNKCDGPDEPAGHDDMGTDPNFDPDEFNDNGHIVGGWHIHDPDNGQGDAGTWPNLQVLILQSSMVQGLSMSGMIEHINWIDPDTGEIIVEENIPVECAATCGSCPTDTDGDGDTDAADLAVLLGGWGPCGPGEPCECLDNDTSGSIDAFDLAVLLGAWGPCL